MKNSCSQVSYVLMFLWTFSLLFLIRTHNFYDHVLVGMVQNSQFTLISGSFSQWRHKFLYDEGLDKQIGYDPETNPSNGFSVSREFSQHADSLEPEKMLEEKEESQTKSSNGFSASQQFSQLADSLEPEKMLEDKEESEMQLKEISLEVSKPASNCATVEQMGKNSSGDTADASRRAESMIQHHFSFNGATRVRKLPPNQFCAQNFVFGKSSEAGFGNEMYKVLTSAALSILLNRSLIIGDNGGKFPFGDYLAFSEEAFRLRELKKLWAKNHCATKYKRPLVMRIVDFQGPTRADVLCQNWRSWKHPIIWLKSTTDSFAIQFFLKNIHAGMRNAAYDLLGDPTIPNSRPNIIGHLMKHIVYPQKAVEKAVSWTLNGGPEPDISLHMRMRTRRSKNALNAAINCVRKALKEFPDKHKRPRLVLVTDTPLIIGYITGNLTNVAEVIHFDYLSYTKHNSKELINTTLFQSSRTRASDWGPMPRWVAFVDFFLASRARVAVISGAHKRVGTTYAQLLAARAAATMLDGDSTKALKFSFYSSFHSSLLDSGLSNQIGWGHAWNRFAGKFSCHKQSDQCALTPFLPYAWWDGPLQSPLDRDIRRLKSYGVTVDESGSVSNENLISFCQHRKSPVNTLAF